MKKLFLLLLIINTFINASAQFKFSGHLTGTTKADTLYINIPYIYGFYHDNDVAIPVDAKGNFNTTLNLSQQKFGNIRFESKAVYLLLTPGKSLVMNYNPADSSATFNGSAAIDNRLLDQLDLNGIPFFAKDYKNNAYAKLGPAELQERVVKPWAAIRDKNTALVQSSALPTAIKAIIIQEIKANYISQLNYFARGVMTTDHAQIFSFIETFYKDVTLSPKTFPAGPMYYQFADSYIGYYEILAFKGLTPAQQKDPGTFLKYYNITLDSGNTVSKLKGKSFVNWILVRNTYPKNIAEAWLAQNIFTKCSTKDLAYAKPLMEEMRAIYPQSKYIPYLQNKINMLQVLLAKNLANKDIIIADRYDKMTSIYQTISKLKGKVVYLDIWGTWCGPCKEELRYNPQLKQQFTGKDVAFVYLDMDEDIKDAQWKEFIKVNGMTGLHLRKSSKDIQQFWAELLPKDKPDQYYPMYFIFDKNGKLVQQQAKRPSDKADLYKQIQRYL
ncbi:TlpA family protein disulfide reductase [Mucilaginibacter glaciei]|uniref:TlpA family protein disulfide reductase n=1 Tax=Mucilaginibacter glaciei TaxID=2772109 RepID=A0A926S0Y2_9SPHI|nr:TlpA disulfide reductase family protein [Mucilaginibacter glaciei]MBD1393445.1 TlpA family protein disulfide reductase [Mucilaginibacter glaciei]